MLDGKPVGFGSLPWTHAKLSPPDIPKDALYFPGWLGRRPITGANPLDFCEINLHGLLLLGLSLSALMQAWLLLRRRVARAHPLGFDYVQGLQAQLAAQAVLATLVDASDDGIIGKDLDGLITSWNAGAERLFGYSSEEVIGWPTSKLYPKDLEGVEERLFERIKQGERIRGFETFMRRKDGERIAVSLSLSPIREGGGRIVGFSKTVRDISEQREAQERIKSLNRELQSRLDELETLLDMVPVPIAIAQDPECRTIRMNRAGERLLGLSPGTNASKSGENAARLPFKVLRDGCELAVDELPMQFALKHGVPLREVEAEILRDDGQRLALYEYASPLFDEFGSVRGGVGVFVDITERKRAEESLREADRRKDEFLAMLAHELRNPLAPIRNALQIMQRLDHENSQIGWSCAVIDRQVAHLGRLLDDLLDVARAMQGKVALKTETVSLGDIVERAVESSHPMMLERRQTLSISLPCPGLCLKGDCIRLAQIISNLLNNASKYTSEGGHIRLAVRQEGDWGVISVCDDGAGIAEDMLPKVFDLFVQADHSLAHSQGGLGLGLPLARELAELHGGTLTGHSEGLGLGSEFTLRLPLLPLAPQACPPPVVAIPAATAGKRLRILVVDDYADTAQTLAIWLRLEGHDARFAESGGRALKLAEEFLPQVVLLDIGLPDVDGYEVARRLRQSPGGASAILVAMTGYGQARDLRLSAEAGFDHHLLKPVDSGGLSDLLRRIAEGGAD